jgi:hypothetical protein
MSRLTRPAKVKHPDNEPFGPFPCPSHSAPRVQSLFPTGPVVRNDRTPNTPVEVTPTNAARQFDQAKVHGAKAALTFVADETRACEPTITIECASRVDNAERQYAWNDKLRFQMTSAELQLLTCLLLGGIDTLTFRNHGDKWCSIARQNTSPYTGTIRMTLGRGDAAEFPPRTVAIDHSTIGAVLALCLRQCARLLRVSVDAVPTVLRVVSRTYLERAGSGSEVPSKSNQSTSSRDGGKAGLVARPPAR